MKSYGVTIQMKPLIVVLSHGTIYLVCSMWTKSCGVTIQIKPLQQYFHMVLFVSQHFTTGKF